MYKVINSKSSTEENRTYRRNILIDDVKVFRENEGSIAEIREQVEILENEITNQQNEFRQVVHDLKNCFMNIIPATELIESGMENDDLNEREKEICVRCLKSGTKNAMELLEKLLPSKKPETPSKKSEKNENVANTKNSVMALPTGEPFTTVDILDLLSDICNFFEPTFNKHNISFNVNYNNIGNGNVLTHEVTLKRVLLNIVSNATKQYNNTRATKITLKAEQMKDCCKYLTISISDNGGGMSSEIREAIVNAPLNGEGRVQSSNSEGTGHGLGLVGVRRMIKDLGGNFNIISDSSKGEGCEVLVQVPLE